MAKHAKISSQASHFFRIILPHILENGTLELPRYFVKENWKLLSKHARLKVPNGEKSKMKLKMRNGRAWLDKGWRDFVEKYKIKCGYFLIFRYEGRSRFNVQIFDLSTSEIEYPRTNHEKCKALLQIKEEDCVDDDDDDREMEMANQSRKLRSWQNSSSIKDKSRARERVLQRAKAFQSPNPHFMIIMKPSYVSSSSSTGLYIPKDGRSYFRKKGKKNMYLSLKGEDGRVWCMKFKILAPRRLVRIYYSGWIKFSQENNLQEGDICAFELVNSMDVEFKVTIFRITDEQADKNDPLVRRGKKEIPNEMKTRKRKRGVSVKEYFTPLQRAEGFKCKEPSFIVMMRKTYVEGRCRLFIPKAHASRYLIDQHGDEILLHRLDGKTWPVKCYTPGLYTQFSSGWKDFVVDNDLQVGDACVFELFPRVSNHYKVTIFRVAE